MKRCGVAASTADCRKVLRFSALELRSRPVDCLPPTTRAALDAGRASYDPDRARACATAIALSPCDAQFEQPTCDVVFAGTVGDGGACAANVDCQPQLGCTRSATQGCPGYCAPRIPAGGESSGGVCEVGSLGLTLSDGGLSCLPFVSAGASCAETVPGRPEVACALGTRCDGLVCRPLAGRDAPCGSTSTCALGLSCLPTLDGGGSRCLGAPDDGEPCRGSDPLQRPCRLGLSCNVDATDAGTCGPLRPLGAGCQGDTSCEFGLTCACGTAGVCTPAARACRPLGGPDAGCGHPALPLCGPGLYCGAAGTCEPTHDAGEACGTPYDLQFSCDPEQRLVCVQGVCERNFCALP